ncbi:MAG: hypothetical protein O9249_00195, partial [Burkholderiaceae bacterium]|nr:hypothetical protein [Burkholderiaceae bacterium]
QNVKSTANWDFYKLIWDCEAWTPEVANYVGELERWHFCAHFIRGEIPLRGGRRARRKALWKEANALSNAVFSHTGWNFAHFLGGSANEYLDFHAGRWLRALDVAGDETAWPIEYYAPQLRWVRARLEANPLFGATDSRMHDIGNRQSPLHCHKVHLSVHAGEDYDHPASGLRHVDETIRFCAMRSGDRLGHALALGIDPGKWMNDHGDALLTVDEHLDNLVWLWHYAGELAEESVHAAQAQQELAQRISRFIPEVNWANGKGPTPQNLFDAWKLRINCPVRLDEAAGGLALSPDLAMVVPDFELLLVSQGQDVSRELYLARVMQEAALDVSTEVESRLVLVRTYKSDLVIDGEPQYMDDVESRNTLLFMRDLQDHLLNKCMENGLCIETNPTSNLYISRLLSYTEHPIFRWSPPESEDLLPFIGKWNQSGLRNGPVSVLINTDDPGIMPTTLRMELALIEAAALELGYEPALVTKWINDIRMRGMDVFGSNHVPVFTQLKP